MSVHLPASSNVADNVSDTDTLSSSEEDENDQTWDDWVSDSATKQPCQSLFDETKFQSVDEALAHDRNTHGFDLSETFSKLSLDFHGQIRLVNYIRKTKPTPSSVNALTGTEDFFSSDEYLIPALEDDPLLQLPSNEWSDDDVEDSSKPQADATRIRTLEKQLAQARQDLTDYREMVGRNIHLAEIVEAVKEDEPTAPPSRDDDTHYFDSYAANDIHAVMIQDKVRTSTYANFIQTHPGLFNDATVLDVGCGTGILSLFAAQAGAKRVIAVDASDIAEKAEKIVKANGFEGTITVVRGKVEDITLPDGIEKVDIIVSEWMGYALLYESMLDSVLRARDRFLRPEGVMAPSQCKMMFALCDGSEIYKERIGFWNDVYGFDLSTMGNDLYDEAIIDVLGPNSLLSEPYTVKDLLLSEITSRQLDFVSSFSVTSTSDRRTKANAFVLYFDTFFTSNGHPISPSTRVNVVKDGEASLAEVWPIGGKVPSKRRQSQGRLGERETSFSTGPQSTPTHWKQTIFLLREPITVIEGSLIEGSFYCKKSSANSRELEVEIHYCVREEPDSPSSDITVQMYKIR
ncbi:protein arginine N-methyltransferase [Pluteus cervinus]|uniref:Protein arginine N-methyltransferase n=1 Tax=Pluteus cervinus TaxID=181527 RepID=A0ACD3AXM4_9AGAR|nr:protein arginine N-methyltransferase [Pluteus cervinus]